MSIVPISLTEANDFVARWHRHNSPVPGHRFSLGFYADDVLHGVAIVGNCSARPWAALGWRWEVRRTCTDGFRNANSALYGACRRETYKRGLWSLVTYTREDEPGTSLRAAGWYVVAYRPPRKGWDTPSRPRGLNGGENVGKFVWEAP